MRLQSIIAREPAGSHPCAVEQDLEICAQLFERIKPARFNEAAGGDESLPQIAEINRGVSEWYVHDKAISKSRCGCTDHEFVSGKFARAERHGPLGNVGP